MGLVFPRKPSRKSGNERGLGLGLSMVNQICKLLGITVEAASTLGEGSEFTLSLPSPA